MSTLVLPIAAILILCVPLVIGYLLYRFEKRSTCWLVKHKAESDAILSRYLTRSEANLATYVKRRQEIIDEYQDALDDVE